MSIFIILDFEIASECTTSSSASVEKQDIGVSLNRASHGMRDTSPMRGLPSGPRTWSQAELRSISSAPPVNPTDSVGCVVLYSNWESGVRGNESTAKGLYDLSVRKQRSEFSKWIKAARDGKKQNSRKPLEPPSFESLAPSLRDQFEERSLKDVPWGYYKIHSCGTVDEAQPRPSATPAQVVQESPHRVTMYETHYQSFPRAEHFLKGGASGDKFAVVYDIPFNKLLTSAFWLSPLDVEVSGCMKPLPSECVECSSTRNLGWCDGHRFLGRGPAAAPCQLAMICSKCRPNHQYRDTKSYICPFCLEEPATMENIYGYCITPPRDDVRLQLPEKNVILPAGAPVLKHGTQWNPAKVHLDALASRETARFVPTLEKRRQRLSSSLKTAFTKASLSQGQEKILLGALSELQEEGLVKFEATLAKKSGTLNKWAMQGDESSFVSKSKIIHIDASGFLQGQSTVQVITLNALDLTQAILLKDELKDCIILNDGVELFFDEAKRVRCIGGEACCNYRWNEIALRNRRRNGKPTLFLNWAADAMIAGGRKRCPGYLTLLNVPHAFTKEATELVCFLPIIHRRKSENVSNEQLEIEWTIANQAIAAVLAPLEEANLQNGADFLFPDGEIRSVNIAVLCICEDIMGKTMDTHVSFTSCQCCFNSNRLFGSWGPDSLCAYGPFSGRTDTKTLALVKKCLLNRSVRSLKTEADNAASEVGLVHYPAINQLLGFKYLFGQDGVYSAMHYDDLHMMFLGVFMTVLDAAELLVRHHYKRTPYVQTEEDALNLLENFLVCLGGMHDGAHRLKAYCQAWFKQESNKGKDYECYFSVLLLLFSTNDDLIENAEVRRKFADIVRLLYSVYRFSKVKKYFTVDEVREIERKALSIHEKMAELFELDVDSNLDTRDFLEASAVSSTEARKSTRSKKDGSVKEPNPQKTPPKVTKWGHETLPGEGTRTGKWHSLFQIGQALMKLGSIKVSSTSYFEEFHRLIRFLFHFTNKHDEAQVSLAVIRSSYLARTKVTRGGRKNSNVRAREFVEKRQSAWGADDDGDAPSENESDASEDSGTFYELRALCFRYLFSIANRFALTLHFLIEEEEAEFSRYMRTGCIWKSKTPLASLLEYLECVDFHAAETFAATTEFLGRTEYITIGPRLQLRRIPASGEYGARPSIVLVPGHYVFLHTKEICLYVGSFVDPEGNIRAMVINTKPYVQKRRKDTKKSSSLHPGALLPWLARCPADEIRAISSRSILCRVFVVPALFVTPENEVSHDGYLLVHGIFNWELVNPEEHPL